MVQVLEKVPGFAEQMGLGVGKLAGEAIGSYFGGRIQGQQLAKENEYLKENYGVDLTGITNPTTRSQIIADELKYGRMKRQAAGTEGIDYVPPSARETGAKSKEDRAAERKRFVEEESKYEREPLPEFKAGAKRKPPKEITPEGLPSNFPQPETKGAKRQILDAYQLIDEGKRIATERNKVGIPTTVEQGYTIAQGINDENKLYNQAVEADIKQKVEAERQYGDIAVKKLDKVFPDATDEHKALFKRKGEEAAREGGTEAQIERKLSEEARKFKNTIANVKKSIPPSRLTERAKQKALGTERDFDKTKNDIRLKLKPLLDEGLYDTSRNLLSELGYHPEEREAIIADLGENARKTLAQFPKLEKTFTKGAAGFVAETKYGIPSAEKQYSPEDSERIYSTIRDIMNAEPSTNLILLRKSLEDKGVDWRTFKDSINDLVLSGEIKPLNDDQFNHLDLLDNPPLDNLDKILFGLKLIGR